MSEKKSYNFSFECHNCGTINRFKISCGTTVEQFLRKAKVGPCPRCGCYPLPPPTSIE